MTRRRLYLVAEVVLPLCALVFMTTVFGRGEMTRLPIGVVDYDASASSRRIVSTLRVVPTVSVKCLYANEQQARSAVSRGEIYGFVVIPAHFEQSVVMQRPTALRYYYHYALMAAGGQLYACLESTLQMLRAATVVDTATALGVPTATALAFVEPIASAEYAPQNPTLDYSVYLTYPYFYVMLQVLVLLLTVYVVGSELRDGTAREWLMLCDDDIVAAVVGKLLPHAAVFALVAAVADAVIFGVARIPHLCPWWTLILNSTLLVMSTMAVGVVVVALFPRLWMAMSVGSMLGSLGATLCGVTFPLRSMFGVVGGVAEGFPIMHFAGLAALQVYGGVGVAYAWHHYAAMILIVGCGALLLPLLGRRVIRSV